MLLRSVGRSLGSWIHFARRRRRGEPQSLSPRAVVSHCRLRNRPPPGPARLRLVRRLPLLARASHPQAGPRRDEGCLRRCEWTGRWRVLPTSTRTSVSGIILLVSFFKDWVFNQYHGAGSDGGQLAVVPPPVAATSPTAVVGGEGCHAGLMGHLLRERRDSVTRCR
jgi:hypothetical protein